MNMRPRPSGGPGGGGPGRGPGGPGVGRGGPGGPGGGPGSRPGGRGPGAGSGVGTAPGGGRGGPGGGGGGAPRPGGGGPGGGARPGGAGRGRSGTAGAFGRPGGRPARGRKSKKQRRQEFDNLQAPAIGGVQIARGNGQVIRLSRGASLSDFADKINANPASLVQVLFHLGELVTATQSVNDETLQLLGAELNYSVQVVSPEEEDKELLESFDIDFGEDSGVEADLAPRPPVVTVMGHVDHGKTKLLDAIRDTNVVAREAGGITQHIGAYQVTTEVDGQERKITFIDTPGHEAFTAMRARGAETTDLVVLVVAADDGVKPQTTEALNHAQAAGVPIVVAVNKIDKEGADPQRVRAQLTEYGLVAEEFGGQTLFVDVSARERIGLDSLLEAIVLTADAELDLRANPGQDAQGVAIEAHLDRGRGPVATVLVQRGTLHVGDSIVSGDAFGRVRAMLDENGDPVAEAPPSRPVQVLGLTAVPGAGDNFLVVSDDRMARQIAERREARERSAQFARRTRRVTLEDLDSVLKAGEKEELLLIVKGDVSGSVEALEDALVKIDVGEDVGLRVIGRGVGAITQDDVNLAIASDAVIIGFNVRPAGRRRAGPARGRGHPVLLGDLPGHRGGRGCAHGHAQARVRRGPARHRGDQGGLPGAQDRQRGGLHRALRDDEPGQQGASCPRRRGRLGQPHGGIAAPVQGRRDRGPRGLRVRYRHRLQRHQARGRDRDLRDAGEAAGGAVRRRGAGGRRCSLAFGQLRRGPRAVLARGGDPPDPPQGGR